MANAALVDSNVFITLLRQGFDAPEWLGDRFDDLYTCGMVRMEVLRGIREKRVRERIAGFFDVLCNVPTDDRLWNAAADLGWQLGRRGITLPGPDLVIAACVQRAGVPVFTADHHFSQIPGLPVLPFDPAD